MTTTNPETKTEKDSETDTKEAPESYDWGKAWRKNWFKITLNLLLFIYLILLIPNWRDKPLVKKLENSELIFIGLIFLFNSNIIERIVELNISKDGIKAKLKEKEQELEKKGKQLKDNQEKLEKTKKKNNQLMGLMPIMKKNLYNLKESLKFTNSSPKPSSIASITPASIIPDSIIPDSITSDSIIPDSITPASITPTSIIPDSIIPDSITSVEDLERKILEIEEILKEE